MTEAIDTSTPAKPRRVKPRRPHKPREVMNKREADFVANLGRNMTAKDAAIAAGVPHKSATQIASRMKRRPPVVKELQRQHAELRKVVCFEKETAMAELAISQDLAILTLNATAHAKASESRARVAGVIEDKASIRHEFISLTHAMTAARARSPLPAIEGQFAVVEPAAPEPSIFD